MYMVSDVFPSQAAYSAVLAPFFLPGRPAALAVVLRNRIEVRALPDALATHTMPDASTEAASPPDQPPLLSVVASIPVSGTVISVRAVPRLDATPGQSQLAVLVDPGEEHVLLISAEHGPTGYRFQVSAKKRLAFSSSLATSSGQGMWTDPQLWQGYQPRGALLTPTPLAVHARPRLLTFLPVHMYDAGISLQQEHLEFSIPHADILSLAPLYSRPTARWHSTTYAVLAISSVDQCHDWGIGPPGMPVLLFVTLHPTSDLASGVSAEMRATNKGKGLDKGKGKGKGQGKGQGHLKAEGYPARARPAATISWTLSPASWAKISASTPTHAHAPAGTSRSQANPSSASSLAGTKRKSQPDSEYAESTRPSRGSSLSCPSSTTTGMSSPHGDGCSCTKIPNFDDSWLSAHVPLAPEDAITATNIAAVPYEWGGGVLLFTETRVLYVPPPGYVRMGPSPGENPGEEKHRWKNRSLKAERHASHLTSLARRFPTLLSHDLPLPVQVVAATPLPDWEDLFVGRILFATQAGELYMVQLILGSGSSSSSLLENPEAKQPVGLSIHSVGQVSAPAGPEGLTYLGEGFVHVASTSGDVMVVQILPSPRTPAPPTIPITASGEEAKRVVSRTYREPVPPGLTTMQDKIRQMYQCTVVKQWAQIGPVMDLAMTGPVAISEGADAHFLPRNLPNSEHQLGTRIVLASGNGPSGSIRTVQQGFSTNLLVQASFPAQKSSLAQWLLHPGSPHKNEAMLLTQTRSEEAKGAVQVLVRALPPDDDYDTQYVLVLPDGTTVDRTPFVPEELTKGGECLAVSQLSTSLLVPPSEMGAEEARSLSSLAVVALRQMLVLVDVGQLAYGPSEPSSAVLATCSPWDIPEVESRAAPKNSQESQKLSCQSIKRENLSTSVAVVSENGRILLASWGLRPTLRSIRVVYEPKNVSNSKLLKMPFRWEALSQHTFSDPISTLCLSPPTSPWCSPFKAPEERSRVAPRFQVKGLGSAAIGTWGDSGQVKIVPFARLYEDCAPEHVHEYFSHARSSPSLAEAEGPSSRIGSVRPTSLLIQHVLPTPSPCVGQEDPISPDANLMLFVGFADGTVLYTVLNMHSHAVDASSHSDDLWVRVQGRTSSPVSLAPVPLGSSCDEGGTGGANGVVILSGGKGTLLTLPKFPPSLASGGWTSLPELQQHELGMNQGMGAIQRVQPFHAHDSEGGPPLWVFFAPAQVSLAYLKHLEKWSVKTLFLGDKNPACLTRVPSVCSKIPGLLVGTYPFMRYGALTPPKEERSSLFSTQPHAGLKLSDEAGDLEDDPTDQYKAGDDDPRGSIQFIWPDDQGNYTYLGCERSLAAYERPNTMCPFSPTTQHHFVAMGTGILAPDKTEVTHGRIAVMHIVKRKAPSRYNHSASAPGPTRTSKIQALNIEPFASVGVPGNVFALTQVGPYLLAAINGSVVLLELDIVGHELVKKSSWYSTFLATSLSPIYIRPDFRKKEHETAPGEKKHRRRETATNKAWHRYRRLVHGQARHDDADEIPDGSSLETYNYGSSFRVWQSDLESDGDDSVSQNHDPYDKHSFVMHGPSFMDDNRPTSVHHARPAESDTMFVVVGDAFRSMTVLQVHMTTGKLTRVAQDASPVWTNATGHADISAGAYISSDAQGGLLLTHRQMLEKFDKNMDKPFPTEPELLGKEPKTGSEKMRYNELARMTERAWQDSMIFKDQHLDRVVRFNYGSVINTFTRGTSFSILIPLFYTTSHLLKGIGLAPCRHTALFPLRCTARHTCLRTSEVTRKCLLHSPRNAVCVLQIPASSASPCEVYVE